MTVASSIRPDADQPADVSRRQSRRRTLWAAITLTTVVGMWTVAASSIDLRQMTDLGLASVLPLAGWAALVLLAVSFSIHALRRPTNQAVLAAHVIVLIVLIHGTPVLLYGSLRYSWAWKHVGIVDYIVRHGHVDRSIRFQNAYHDWPGFFALNALFVRAAGLRSATSYAGWAPVASNLMFLGPLLLILRSRTSDARHIWIAVWLFYMANWIGQDYFSPQAFAYFCYLVLIAIVLRWFTPSTGIGGGGVARARRLAHRLLGPPPPADPAVQQSRSQRVAVGAIAALLVVVIASSHQLTPFMLIAGLLGLAVLGVARVRGLAGLALVVTAAWVVLIAEPFIRENVRPMLDGIGQIGGNASSNFVNLAHASPGQATVSLVDRALTVAVGLLAAVGWAVRRRRGHRDIAFWVLAVAPVPLIFANGYGGEMLFRVYLFSLPFLAFFGAGLATSAADSRAGRWRRSVAATLVGICLMSAFVVAYYGKERINYFTHDEVAAGRWLSQQAKPGALLVAGTGDYPWGYEHYEWYTYIWVAQNEPADYQAAFVAHPVDVLGDLMSDPRMSQAFFLVSRGQIAQVNMTGALPAGSLERVRQELLDSPRFRVVFENRDATIFTLASRAGA